MNTRTTNPTTAVSRLAHFSRMIRGLLGVTLSATLIAALLFVAMVAGCKEDEGGVVGPCDNCSPLASMMSPACGATGVALNQRINATFSQSMDSSTFTTATFILAGPSGSPVSGAVSYVSATNIATFTPASNLAASTAYTFTIRGGANGVKDRSGNGLANNFGCSFTTGAASDNTPPTVISTNPASNATGVPLSKVTSTDTENHGKGAKLNKTSGMASGKIITATFNEAMDPVSITSSTFTVTGPGVTPVTGLVAYAGTSFTATFVSATNLAPNATYTGTITSGAKDASGNALASNYVWTFTTGATADITPPSVISTDPGSNTTGVALNKKIAATFSEAMNASTLNATTFTLKQGTTSVLGTVDYTGTTALFTPAVNLASNTLYTATITTGAKDLAGNPKAASYVWNFTTGAAADVTPPTVTSTDPLNNATGVALNKKIAATFSESVDPLTLGAATFTLRQGTTVIPGTLAYAGTTEIFTPASSLAPNTVYTATMSTGVKDLAGNAMASNFVWSFTTASGLDVLPPTVVSTDPANNATGVALNKTIITTFSEAMDQSTITLATVRVTGLGGIPIIGTISHAGGVNAVTFTAASNLPANTTFTGTIKGGAAGAEDLAGNALASDYVWSFTTGVALNKKIAAIFSEAMNASTLNATFTLKQGTTSVSGSVSYTGTTALFTPAANLAPNTVYTATITTGAKDLAGNALASDYIWNFTTGAAQDIAPPTVISTDPANNATGVPLSKVSGAGLNKKTSPTVAAVGKLITATFNEAMDPETISSSTFMVTGPGVTPVTGLLVAYTGSSLTATFISANKLAPNTTYTGTITTGAKDLAGNALASNYVWNFTTGAAPDTTLPTVIFTDPDNGAIDVALNKKIAATFSEVMNLSAVNATTFRLQTGATFILGAVTYTGTTALFAPSGNLAPNTVYKATITIGARDLAGNNLGSDYVWNFTTGAAPDIAPPTVVSTDPLNNATGVALNKKIAATFSETMNPLTITTSTFAVRRGTTPVSGTFTHVGMTSVFSPASNLAPNTVYTATITTGAEDLAGNGLASNYVWNFTTGAAADVLPPTVTSTDPISNATGVAINKKIVATFNEAMDQTTITTATVTVTGLGGVPVSGSVIYAIGASTMTFTPATNLATNTTFTVTIKGGATGAKDLAGNALASNYIWSFTTGAAPDLTPPTVVLTDPLCSSFGIPTNKKIAVTFSEAMNQATITAATFTVTGPGGASVAGTVTYVAASKIATFATTNFAFLSTYTFTIHSGAAGVKDLAGNPMVNDFVCNFTTGALADNTAPTVISTDPVNNATGVALNKIITATFSEAMDLLTIQAPGTFTLKQGLTVVNGTVSFSGTIASFTPDFDLALNTVYTAKITTVAEDMSGNAMASDKVWSFTTTAGNTGPAPVDLLSNVNFVILAGSQVTNIPTSNITGDVGLSPAAGSNYAGLTQPEVAGTIYTVNAAGPAGYVIDVARLTAAKGDLTIAYNDAAGRTPVPTGPFLNPGAGNIGGSTLVAGLYKFTGSAQITGSDVTLTGSATDVWIFQIASNFNVGNGIKVILGGSAQAKNIFWQVGTSATLGTTSVVEGTIMADQLISLATGATLNGRALTFTGAVTLDKAILVRPPL